MHKLFLLSLSGESLFTTEGTLPDLLPLLSGFLSAWPGYSTTANSLKAKRYYVGDFQGLDGIPKLVVIVPKKEN